MEKGVRVWIITRYDGKKVVTERECTESEIGTAFTDAQLEERDRVIWNAARERIETEEIIVDEKGFQDTVSFLKYKSFKDWQSKAKPNE